MQKWMIWGLAFLLGATGVWYFLLKSYDYKLSFHSSAAPGSIYLRVLNWKPDGITILEKKPYESLIQEVEIRNISTELKWELTPINDSLTLIEVSSKTLEANFIERLKLLIVKTDQQKALVEEVKVFRNFLEKDKDLFDINVEGVASMPEAYCACITLTSSMEEKAAGMMKNIGVLQDYIEKNDLDLIEKPRVQVREWDSFNNKIEFDFCFPLDEKDKLPQSGPIEIKKIPTKKALKASFHGNYIFSHHAWLQLVNYAEIHGYTITDPPLEIYINNPELGGDSRNWTAEIYLPVK